MEASGEEERRKEEATEAVAETPRNAEFSRRVQLERRHRTDFRCESPNLGQFRC